MKTINCKINDSAHKKLKNLQKRKGYSELGDFIAYLVKQENKRLARNSESEKADGTLSRRSALSGHSFSRTKKGTGRGTGRGTDKI